jgi:polysaccharide export outer membrane protein
VQVDNGGQIDLPLIGEVTAAGKTPRELERDVAARLDKGNYVEAPQVTVLVKDSASQKFTVEGAVKLSGVFPLQGQMTLLRAIATAQGVDGDANQRDVVIFRTVNQQRVAGVIDLGRVRAGKIDDPKIYPGDTVVVMTSKSRRALKDLIGLAPLFFLFTLI